MLDTQGLYSKKAMKHFLRDGKRFIAKVEKELEHSIDPIDRCERHDRHL